MNQADDVDVSIVVPAYNEEKRIGDSLRRLGEFLERQPYTSEVIVSDDGSANPGRVAALMALAALPPRIERRIIRSEVNRGKGAAVRSGCLDARGRCVAFIDADLATPPEELTQLLEALQAGSDIAIGVRKQADGSDMRSRRGLPRRLAGQAYAFLTRRLLLSDFEDTQCPLKAFTREAAQRIFPLQRVESWAFDAELLFLARRMHMRIAQVPVSWRAVGGSHLQLNARSALELWNLLKVRWWHRAVKANSW